MGINVPGPCGLIKSSRETRLRDGTFFFFYVYSSDRVVAVEINHDRWFMILGPLVHLDTQ